MARVGVVRRGSRFSRATIRLLLLILIVVGMVVTVTAVFLMLSSGSSDLREADQTGGSSADGTSLGDSATQEIVGGERETIKREAKAGAGDDSSRFGTKLHQNHAAGYSVRYPVHWELEKHRTSSKLTSPDRHFVVSFGLGPKGRVSVAYDEFVALLDETYADVTVEMVDATHVADSVAVLARGRATTNAGMRVRFLVTVIERPNNQRVIGALAATDLRSAKFPPPVRKILSSLRPI